MANLSYDLKNLLIKENYQFIVFNTSGCIYVPGFYKFYIQDAKITKCNIDYLNRIRKILSNESDSIIIFGGRFPLYLNKSLFNNKEGGVEAGNISTEFKSDGTYLTIEDSFKNEVLALSERNKIILIYPIPEVGWDLPRKMYLEWLKRDLLKKENFVLSDITTSFKVYKERSSSSFKLLDSINNKNIYRIYPHEVFCNLDKYFNRCVTHNDSSIFYVDSNHLTNDGAKKINNMILKKIKSLNSTVK